MLYCGVLETAAAGFLLAGDFFAPAGALPPVVGFLAGDLVAGLAEVGLAPPSSPAFFFGNK